MLVGAWLLLMFVIVPVYDRLRGRRGPKEKKYDDAGYYSDRPEGEAVAAIALFFRWCAAEGLLSEDHTEDPDTSKALARVVKGTLSASEYVWEYMSGKFGSGDLSDEGNRVARALYGRPYRRILAGLAPKLRLERDVDFAALREALNRERASLQLAGQKAAL